MSWQPIEKLDKKIIIFDVLVTYYDLSGNKRYKRYVNVWHDGHGFVIGTGEYLKGVTHWMPLPEPPQ